MLRWANPAITNKSKLYVATSLVKYLFHASINIFILLSLLFCRILYYDYGAETSQGFTSKAGQSFGAELWPKLEVPYAREPAPESEIRNF